MSMQLSYRLQRLCGSVYENGNIIFTPDGNSIISPIGNRVTVFDLVHHKTTTFPFENRKDIEIITISNNGLFLLTIDIEGHALLINFPRMIVLTRIHFKKKVYDAKFSPDDKLFAITYGSGCQIWRTPGIRREFSPLVLQRTIGSHNDDVVCLDWSIDSKSLIMGSRDLFARIYYNVSSRYMSSTLLSGHRDSLVGAFFGKTSHDAYTVSRNGSIFTWNYEKLPILDSSNDIADEECNDESKDNSDESDDDDDDDSDDDNDQVLIKRPKYDKTQPYKEIKNPYKKSGLWKLTDRKFLWEEHSEIVSVAFNKSTGLLVVGFHQGTFGLYEMPGCTNLHRLTISTASITTSNINNNGEWLVLGSTSLGQLCVWEWKSESFILKQQGHVRGLNTLDYSKDGQFIATGGEDGKLKLWNTLSGFCVVTFSDHLAPITCVRFVGQGNGKAVLSASLDGSIRAYDLLRYHNFKILTSPTAVQFTSLAVDNSGEVVCAGALDPFNIYVWSLQTGQLLDVLAGHEGPICCLEMSTGVSTTSVLASGSWDGTMKLWNVYENKNIETMEHGCDVLALAFRPDGKEVCTCTTNGNINFWDVETGEQIGIIEGKQDIGGGRLTSDIVTSKTSSKSKCFTAITYSSDGLFVLAGGRRKYTCIYAVATKVLVKRFQLSFNRSLDGILDKLHSDRLVEGISLDTLPVLTDLNKSTHSGRKENNKYLPGSHSSKLNDGSRSTRPELVTSSIRFSATGREWAAATTQGLQIFALDNSLIFAPTDLDITITPQTILEASNRHDHGLAINMALQLNEKLVLKQAFDSVPVDSISLVVKSMNQMMIQNVLKFLAEEIIKSKHLEFHLTWCLEVLQQHGATIQSSAAMSSMMFAESLRSLIRSISIHERDVMKMCDENKFTLQFLMIRINQQMLKEKSSQSIVEAETVNDNDS